MQLEAVLDYYQSDIKQNKSKNLGGEFMPSLNDNEILFKVSDTDDPVFWKKLKSKFAINGTKAIIQTANETYQLLLDENDEETFRKYVKIPFLQDKNHECYHRSDGDLLFCERDAKQSYL